MTDRKFITTWDDEDVARYYEAFCTQHDRYERANEDLISRAAIVPGCRVLDFAAGQGGTTVAALRHLGDRDIVTCVEPAASMREISVDRICQHRTRWLSELPEREEYDRVVCGAAIWMIEPIEEILRTLSDMIAPGGLLAFNIPASYLGIPDEPGGGEDPYLTALPAMLAQLELGLPELDVPDSRTPCEITKMLEGFDLTVQTWETRYRLNQSAYRDWFKIPIVNQTLLGKVPANRRPHLIDWAYDRIDQASWRWESWVGWCATKRITDSPFEPSESGWHN